MLDKKTLIHTYKCECNTIIDRHRQNRYLRLWKQSCVFPQLDGDEDSPNFDEDGQDEYNEIHMLV